MKSRPASSENVDGDDDRDTVVTKILQSEVVFGLLVKDRSSGQFCFLHTEKVCAPQDLECTKAEVLKRAVEAQVDMPYWKSLISKFPVQVRRSTLDRASPNLKMHGAMSYEQPTCIWLRAPCVVHILATAQGRSFGTQKGLVSGMIAVALTVLASGSTRKMRKAL